MPRSQLRNLFGAILLALVLSLLTLFIFYLRPAALSNIDFSQYWSASRLLQTQENPYDKELIFELQRSILSLDEAVLLWNPPIIIPLIYPLAFLSFELAASLWSTLLLAFYTLSFALIATALGAGKAGLARNRLAWIFVATFPPIFSSLYYGQISPLLLLGFSGYMFLLKVSRPSKLRDFSAGFFLALTLLKPHLLYLIFLRLIFDSFKLKQARFILMGAFSCLLCLTTLALLIEPRIFEWYFSVSRSPPIYFETPTLGSFLQWITQAHNVWIRFLPTVLSALLFVIFISGFGKKNHSRDLDWQVLLPLSLLTSPYGWTFDQILLLPSALYILSSLQLQKKAPKGRYGLYIFFLLLNNFLYVLTPFLKYMQFDIYYSIIILVLALSLQHTGKRGSKLEA